MAVGGRAFPEAQRIHQGVGCLVQSQHSKEAGELRKNEQHGGGGSDVRKPRMPVTQELEAVLGSEPL